MFTYQSGEWIQTTCSRSNRSNSWRVVWKGVVLEESQTPTSTSETLNSNHDNRLPIILRYNADQTLTGTPVGPPAQGRSAAAGKMSQRQTASTSTTRAKPSYSMLYYTNYTILYYTILYYTILHYTILYCTFGRFRTPTGHRRADRAQTGQGRRQCETLHGHWIILAASSVEDQQNACTT